MPQDKNFYINLMDSIDQRWTELQKFEQVAALHKYVLETVPHIVKGGGLYLASTVKWMRWVKLFRYIFEKTDGIDIFDGDELDRRDFVRMIRNYYNCFKIELDKFNDLFYPLDEALEYIYEKFPSEKEYYSEEGEDEEEEDDEEEDIEEEEDCCEEDVEDEEDYYEEDEDDFADLPPLERDEDESQPTNYDPIDFTFSFKNNVKQTNGWKDATQVPWESPSEVTNEWGAWGDTAATSTAEKAWDNYFNESMPTFLQSSQQQNRPDLFEPLEPLEPKKPTYSARAIQIAKRFEYSESDLKEFQMIFDDLYNDNYLNEKINHLMVKINPDRIFCSDDEYYECSCCNTDDGFCCHTNCRSCANYNCYFSPEDDKMYHFDCPCRT